MYASGGGEATAEDTASKEYDVEPDVMKIDNAETFVVASPREDELQQSNGNADAGENEYEDDYEDEDDADAEAEGGRAFLEAGPPIQRPVTPKH